MLSVPIMDEFRITTAWVEELRVRARVPGWISITSEQARALAATAERDLRRAESAKILRFPRDGIVPNWEMYMSRNQPEDETQAPGHFGNQGKPAPKSKKVDLEEQYQRTRERAPSGEKPSSEHVEADK